MNIYLDLFLTFAKIGVCTFGGGYAMLPILQREIVENKHWVSDEELNDYFAVGQCTPGVIAVNTATFVGCKLRGWKGGTIATVGVVFPSIVIITLIAAFLSNFQDNIYVRHAFAGVRACVCVLILNAVIKLRKSSVIDLPTTVLFLIVFACSALCGLSPALLVVFCGLVGLGIKQFRERKHNPPANNNIQDKPEEACPDNPADPAADTDKQGDASC